MEKIEDPKQGKGLPVYAVRLRELRRARGMSSRLGLIRVFSATESVIGINMAAVAVELMNAPTEAAAPIIMSSSLGSLLPPRRMIISPTR